MKVFFCLLVALFLTPPALHAGPLDDNFDDNVMDAMLWASPPVVFDPEGRIGVSEQNSRLEFSTAGWGDAYQGFGGYRSQWMFVVNNSDNFSFQADFTHHETAEEDRGVALGIYNLNGGGAPSTAGIFANSIGGVKLYETDGTVSGIGVGIETARPAISGRLLAEYIAVQDKLVLKAQELASGVWTDVAGASDEIFGLRTVDGATELGAFIGAWSDGASIAGSDVFIDNFVVTSGVVTPEPAGSALFMVGAAAFAAFGRRKRYL